MGSRRGLSGLSLVAVWCLLGLVSCARPSEQEERVGSTSSALSSFLQTNFACPASSQSVAVSFTAVQTAGDLNVVVVGWTDDVTGVTSVTDTAGNTYTLALGPTVLVGTVSQSIYYAKNIVHSAAGANAVTVVFSGVAPAPDIRVVEYGGLDTSSPLDVTAVGIGNSAASTTGAVTTGNASDLLVASNYVQAITNQAGTGFTSRVITSDDDIVEDKAVSAIGSYSASAPLSSAGWWAMQMVAFRVAPAGTPPAAPTAPTGLTAVAGSGGSRVNLAWTDTATTQGGVKIERSTDGVTYAQIAIAPTSGTSYMDTGRAAGATYWYRVRATGTGGDSTYVGPVSVATLPLVQINSASPGTVQSVSVRYSGAQRASDLNVVVVGWKDSVRTVSSVTDSAGNAYTRAVGPTVVTGVTQSIYYAKNIVASAANANAVTVAFSALASRPDVRALEYTGLDPTSPLDVTAAASGTSGTTTSSGAATTTHAHDLLVGANYVINITLGPGAGFADELITSDDNIVEDEAVSAVGAYTATAPQSVSGNWVMQMVAFKVADTSCPASDACHVAGTIDPMTGICTNPPAANGTTCSDGNACTQSDTCQSGACTGGNPVTCTASDPCHVAGTCNTSTGTCSNPTAANGTTCSDGNACTQTDTCQSGTCTGGNPVACTASDPCHVAGTCNTSTGTCSNPTAANGTTCSDGNACTQTDTCQGGACTAGSPVTCTASDQCHAAGTCDTGTGTCSNPTAANGTTCSDGNACTQTDTCQSGTCTGGNPVACTASDQCHVAGTCNTSSGTCSNPTAANGTTCSDGNACTQTDTCQSGTCAGGNPVACTASDQCHVAGTCNTTTGTCSNPTAANGTTCSDGNACTQTDTCQSGTCTGSNSVTCTASDPCHVAGTCNTGSGTCSNPTAANGTTCSDGNACTQTDTCQSGTCTGSNSVTCTASDQCHVAGTCSPSTGTCSNPTAANGASCSDGNACTQTDTCQGGACTGGSPVTCTASDQCHVAGTCDTGTGTCSNPAATDGTACNDGNPNTQNDACQAGVCAGSNACSPVDVCHQAGTFNGATGTCTAGPPVNIDDGNACTLDTCDPVNGIVHHPCAPIDRTVSTSLASASSFVFSGANPSQTGVAAGTIAPATMALLRGNVFDATGAALPGVTVTVAGHPELGSTLTQGSGTFDIAVNGGQPTRLHFALNGYLPSERLVQAPWQDYANADDVTLIQVDILGTLVDLSNTADVQIHRAATITDDAGVRTATVMVPPSTTAELILPDGGTENLGTMTVRATEYTVGTTGPSKMPGALPPSSMYTYAVELSADEAVTASATSVVFSQPLPFYLENFLGMPVGAVVPAGYYDTTKGAWVPAASGVVIKILSEGGTPPQAGVDVNGDGVVDTGSSLTALGITILELQHLATLYAVGQSLWRVPLAHFSAYDLNWGWAPPDGGAPPPVPPPPPPPPGPGGCQQIGSIIDCQRQALGEDLPIAGTPYSLHYVSDHQRGRQAALDVPLSGSTLPGAVKRIDLEVDVAGRAITESFAAQTNQTTTFVWDGTDAYGRLLQGGQPVTVRVSNVYDGFYLQPSASTFGYYGTGTAIGGSATRKEVSIQRVWTGILGGWDDRPGGVGGWSVNVHHAYDIAANTIHFGDGSELTPASLPGVMRTFAGTGVGSTGGSIGTGGPASAARVTPEAVAVGPDGTIYIVDIEHCVRNVGLDGIIRVFAGICFSAGFSGDGGPATSATLHSPVDIAFGPDGSLFIAESGNNRIRRVDPNGIIHTVAGTGAAGFSGDGGPAIQAALSFPTGVDVTSDGTIYIADENNSRIRRVGPDGTIRTVAGVGPGFCFSQATIGFGGPATAAHFCVPRRVRAARDGSIYVADYNGAQVDRVGTDGIIEPFAGNATSPANSGNGGPAAAAGIEAPSDIAVGPDGSLYVAGANTIRRVDPDGTISTVVGQANSNGFAGNGGPAAAATIAVQQGGIRVAPDGTLYIAEAANNVVRRVQPALPTFTFGTSVVQFSSSDGKQAYTFDTSGRHLETVDAFTGATLYQFAYDSAGRLFQIADVDGNITTINRDGQGNPQSITPPSAQPTTLTVDTNGYLNAITDPAQNQAQFTYSAQGLMMTMTDARGNLHQFSYDSLGRLTEDQDPAGGSKALARTDISGGFNVAITTALGRTSTYQTTLSSTGTFGRMNTFADGMQASLQFTTAGVSTTTVPDGTTTTETQTPDPRFGMLSPLLATATKTPSGLTSTLSTTRSFTTTGGSLATFTEQTTVNGNTWTKLFNSAAHTWTTTSPLGRTTTTTVNAAERPTQISIPGVAPFSMTYDSNGRPATMTQGGHTWTNAYDPSGYLSSITDALNHAVTYENDAVGRATQTILQDGRSIGTSYDADGNPTVITLPTPNQNAHDFAYTPIDLISSYTPPSLGGGSTATSYAYNADRQPTIVTRPDGVALTYGYDAFGRLNGIAYPQGTLSQTYNATTGQLSMLTSPSGETLGYSYDGFLRTGMTWSGPVAGSVSFGYDSNFRVNSQTVNNANALMLGFDADSLLTQAGSLTVSRDPQNGRVTGTALGSVTDTYSYDVNGLLSAYVANYSGNAVYSESVLRDALGRITQKTETIGGATHVFGYTFDPAGRLTDVSEDSVAVSHYGYDSDDNRTTFSGPGGPVSPTYDAQDRLLTYGSATYAYTANGELTTKTIGGQATGYTYDALGNLLHVGPPTGSAIDYVVDGENRRVGKKLGGTLSQGFLYQDALNVVAQLDGSANVVARFVFGTKPNVPDYYTTSAGTFRILSDHLGSPRLIVNTSSGSIAERIDYDEFGNVTQDTSPGLTPFGFAGGLYDKDTGLVRFGARDYDASVGRWTTKDPIRFAGGVNLYGYVVNDPVNEVDSAGMAPGPAGTVPDPSGGGGSGAICGLPKILCRDSEQGGRCWERCMKAGIFCSAFHSAPYRGPKGMGALNACDEEGMHEFCAYQYPNGWNCTFGGPIPVCVPPIFNSPPPKPN
jgi:RHS repeat-associated protein